MSFTVGKKYFINNIYSYIKIFFIKLIKNLTRSLIRFKNMFWVSLKEKSDKIIVMIVCCGCFSFLINNFRKM